MGHQDWCPQDKRSPLVAKKIARWSPNPTACDVYSVRSVTLPEELTNKAVMPTLFLTKVGKRSHRRWNGSASGTAMLYLLPGSCIRWSILPSTETNASTTMAGGSGTFTSITHRAAPRLASMSTP